MERQERSKGYKPGDVMFSALGGTSQVPPPVERKFSSANLGSMIHSLLERCASNEQMAYSMGAAIDQLNEVVVLLQHELTQVGEWDTIRCPNCHKPTEHHVETVFGGTPQQTYVIHWRCETRRCAWHGLDREIGPPGRVKA